MVIECSKCLYTSEHPLGITFNEKGLCSGCEIHKEKDYLDWEHRLEELKKLVDQYKSKEAKYDCIVPVSGARDSYFILHIVVNVLKLKPLVVSYNKMFNTNIGIQNLSNLRLKFDVDFQQKNVSPRILKKITRKSLHAFGNMYWHCLAGETVFPVQTAVMMKIPLIIWGAHQGIEQVGMFSHLHNVEMTRRYRKDHDLFGVDTDNLIDDFDNLTDEDLLNYKYPSFSDIESIGVRGIYLSNYIRWDTYAQHKQMVEQYDYKGAKFSRTFDGYDNCDSFVYNDIHDILKLYKYGYSKVTDQACREIRFGRLSKDEAERLVAYYEIQEPKYIDIFCDWLGIDQRSLLFSINRHRNKKFWTQHDIDKWTFNKKTCKSKVLKNHNQLKYSNISSDIGDKYVVVGKGVDWPKKNSNKDINWL